MTGQNIKRFRLNIVNAAEDIPRLMRTYGKLGRGLEAALVLRPVEGRGILVRIDNGDARIWRPSDTVEGLVGRDVPRPPEQTIDPKDAVTAVKEAQKAPGKPGPISLRGLWRGYFYCDNGTPRVELNRKIATYGLLTIVSDPEKGWQWRIERQEKWFSETGQDEGAASSLREAIAQGLARSMGLLGVACSMRDSHRRAAFDNAWAEKHPIRPAAETRDPLERLKPKEPRKRKARASRTSSQTTGRAANGTAGQAPNSSTGRSTTSSDSSTGSPASVSPSGKAVADRTTRKRTAPSKPAVRKNTSTASAEIDPAKDAALMDSFSQAVAIAIQQQLGGGTR